MMLLPLPEEASYSWGGYMIFFNLLNLLPRLLLPDSFRYAPLLEISGGPEAAGRQIPFVYVIAFCPLAA